MCAVSGSRRRSPMSRMPVRVPRSRLRRPKSAELPDYGFVHASAGSRRGGVAWLAALNRARALQSVVGSTKQGDGALALAPFTEALLRKRQKQHPAMLRDLLEIRPAGPENQASGSGRTGRQHHEDIHCECHVVRIAGSPEAHQTIKRRAMNLLGARSNTGEGGEDPAVYGCADRWCAIPSAE